MITLTEIVDDDILAIECPYREDFLEEFKTRVPPEARDPKQGMGWDKEDRCWRIHLDYTEVVEELIEKYFPECDVKWEYE